MVKACQHPSAARLMCAIKMRLYVFVLVRLGNFVGLFCHFSQFVTKAEEASDEEVIGGGSSLLDCGRQVTSYPASCRSFFPPFSIACVLKPSSDVS